MSLEENPENYDRELLYLTIGFCIFVVLYAIMKMYGS